MWAKVDDQWWAHGKVLALSLEARGLWITALSWSCMKRTPVVPTSVVTLAAAGADVSAAVAALVDAGLWHEVDGGWEIHDWSEYQELSKSEKRAEAGRKGGKASGKSRREESSNDEPPPSNAKQNEANGKQEAKQETPVPEPVPEPEPVDQGQTHVPPDGGVELQLAAVDDGPPDSDPVAEAFEHWWQAYPRRQDNNAPGGGGSKAQARKKWRRLTDLERRRATKAIELYHLDLQVTGTYVCHAVTWLNQARYDDLLDREQDIRDQAGRAPPEPGSAAANAASWDHVAEELRKQGM